METWDNGLQRDYRCGASAAQGGFYPSWACTQLVQAKERIKELEAWRARWEPVVEAARQLAGGVRADGVIFWEDLRVAVRKAEETP